MAAKWTDEQQSVINARGKSLLVSAAAGSGKTAVLTERIISLITDKDEPADIDRMLVLTFTEAAASEMKERIGKALRKILEEDPGNEAVRRQSVYLGHAHISTVHSFCSYVIRNYFHTTGVDPSCRVMDGAESELLISEVTEELLNRKYEENDEDLVFFARTFFTEKNADARIAGLIRRVYDFAEAAPWPLAWLEHSVKIMEDACEDPGNAGFIRELTEKADETVKAALSETEQLILLASGTDGPAAYVPVLENERSMYERYLSANTFDEKKTAADAFDFARAPSRKGKTEDPVLREKIKNARNAVKADIAAVRDEVFASDAGELKKELEYCLPLVKAICSLTGSFIELYDEAKRRRGVMDFSDMEHYALDILVKRGEDGQLVRTDAAKELASYFSTVMTDEYQDTNEVQETILWSVSGEEDGRFNRFMVGDIKQAIYGFRHARPEIFIEKYRSFGTDAGQRERIDLNKNFRSRGSVIAAVNHIFGRLMSPEIGGIEYDENAALSYGGLYENAGEDPSVEILLADKKEAYFSENAAADLYAATEARMAAKHIKKLMKTMRVTDKETGQTRPLAYGDCAILMRSVSGVSNIYTRVLMEEGIPAYAPLRTGYFGASEINTILDYLRIVDNPAQDIPLTAALFSPIGGLTAPELALIRCSGKGNFHALCAEYVRTGGNAALQKKLKKFFDTLEYFREKVPFTPVHRLIGEILKVTGFGVYAAAMPGGTRRAANLNMLESKALDFEKKGNGSLFLFIRYIDQMISTGVDFGEAGLFSQGTDAVAVTSIHRSKGLEYPLVFLCGAAKQFNKTDLNANVLLGYEQGIGIDAVNAAGHTTKNTTYKKSVRLALEKDLYGEELRILYVALTRAREKLVITGAVPNLERSAGNCELRKNRWKSAVPAADMLKGQSYMDWIFMALANDACFEPVYRWAGIDVGNGIESCVTGAGSEPPIRIVIESAELLEEELMNERRSEAGMLKELPAEGSGAVYDEETARILAECTSFEYPFKGAEDIPAKVSVSELKRLAYEAGSGDEGEAFAEEKTVIPYIPEFMRKKETKLTAAEAGTVFHELLENLDLKALGNGNVSRDEALRVAENTADTLMKKGRFSPEEREAADCSAAAEFILSDIGTRMRLADCRGELKRETPFTMSVSASSLNPVYETEEPVLIQGIIDAYFTEDGKNILVDYKTDRVRSADELIKRYGVQLRCYAEAIHRATGIPVSEMIIYSVSAGTIFL